MGDCAIPHDRAHARECIALSGTNWLNLRFVTPLDLALRMGAPFLVAAEIIRSFTGSDRHNFCMTTLTAVPAGSTRCFETFSQAQAENTNSRVYVGIPFRSAIEAGDRLGRRIGSFAFTHTLQPLRKHRDQ
jgi:hypothetical protein